MTRPLPTPPRDPRLDELFARYWDDALSDAEAAELDRRLATDPAARDWFRFLSLQAAVAAEGSAVARVNGPAASGRAGRGGACCDTSGRGWRPASPPWSSADGSGPMTRPSRSGWRTPAARCWCGTRTAGP